MSPVGEQEEAMAVEHKEYGRVRVFTAESLEAFAQLDNWTVPLERLQLDVRMSAGGEGFLQEEDSVDLDWKADLSDDGSEKLQVKNPVLRIRIFNFLIMDPVSDPDPS